MVVTFLEFEELALKKKIRVYRIGISVYSVYF